MKRLGFADTRTEEYLIAGWKQGVRKAVARELRRLQKGERPLAFRPLPEFGSQVAELKRGALRVVYTTELPDVIGVACAFRKDSKDGSKMRPEHKTAIDRGLGKLRSGAYVASDEIFRVH